jgi:hypothetical protein
MDRPFFREIDDDATFPLGYLHYCTKGKMAKIILTIQDSAMAMANIPSRLHLQERSSSVRPVIRANL